VSRLSDRSSPPATALRPIRDLEELRLDTSTLVLVALLGFAGIAAIDAYHFFVEGHDVSWVALPVLLGLFAVPVLFRVFGNQRASRVAIPVILWLIAALTVTMSGGATSKAHYLFALVPLFAAGLLSPRASFAWALIALASEASFYALDALGIALPHRGIHAYHIDIPSASLATVIVFVVTASLVLRRRAARREVEAAVGAVAVANQGADAARICRERAIEARQVILGKVGHGFRGPLEVILDATRQLRGELHEGFRDHAEMIDESAGALIAKLDTFAAHTRAWSISSEVRAPLAPAAIGRVVIAAHEGQAAAANVTLGFVESAPLGERLGDASRIKVLLDVLVGHAVAHAAGDRITMTVEPLLGDDVRFELDGVAGPSAILGVDRDLAAALTPARRLARALGGGISSPEASSAKGCLAVVLPLPEAPRRPGGASC